MTLLFENVLLQKLEKYKNKKLIIAYSGGKDSTALLHYLCEHNKNFGYFLVPVYINHNIRDDVYCDITHCKEFCKLKGLPLIIESVKALEFSRKKRISIEEAARILRYEKLQKIMNEYKCDYILTAHNFNDLVENFFIKIFRGTSIFKLKGFNNSVIIDRPMMEIPVAEIFKYLEKYNISYITDKTNSDNKYLRNWVRENLIKKIEQKNIAFLNKIALIQEESELLAKYMEKHIKLPYEETKYIIKIFKDKFLLLSDLERRFYLSQIIPLNITKNILNEVDKILYAKDSKRIHLHGGYIFEKSINYIYIFKKELIDNFNIYKKENNEIVGIDHLKKVIYFDNYLKHKRLLLRNRRPGDRFSGKKLKDLFINKKLDLFDRDTSIVVEDNGNILWVEHLTENNKSVQIMES
jgi:tRNA(Ile)-lysidine synthase